MSIHDDDDEIENYRFEDAHDDAPDMRDAAGDQREMMRCPNCKKWILEDSPKCPYCKNWIVEDESTHKSWVKITAIVLLLVTVLGLIGGGFWLWGKLW